MSNTLKPPIILFGNTRSGTTLVQNLVCEHPGMVAWYEPRTLWLYADPGRPDDEFDERDATPKVVRFIRKQFERYQRSHGDRAVMEKTPANIFKIPYVRAILPEARYLYIVREPFAFISSVEFKWQSRLTAKGIRRRLRYTPVGQWPFYAGRFLRDLVAKKVLHRKYLKVWGPRYRGMLEDLETHDLLTVIARQWAEGSRRAARDLAWFEPGRVLAFRYEDLVADPVPLLERICHHVGLDMTVGMERAAIESVKPDRQDKWRRFDPRDLARILPEIEGEMARHGYPVPEEIRRVDREEDAGEPAGRALMAGAGSGEVTHEQ
jgi:hypothetical protein